MNAPTQIVTTDSVAPAARLQFWQSQVGSLLTHLECSSSADQTFSGRVKAHQTHPASVLEISAATHMIARAKPKISQTGEERVFVCIQIEGKAHVEQDGQQGVLYPGDMTLLDTSRAFQAEFPEQMSQHVLQIPKALVRKQVGTVERFAASVIPCTNTVGLLTCNFVSGLARNFQKLDSVIARRLTEQATDMALMAFVSSLNDTRREPRKITVAKSMLAHRGRAFIEERLRDAALQPHTVADHLGISKRYLNSVFALHGHTVERFIWDRRLARCARDLKDPGQSGRAIGDIAFSWGFHSLTHFSQAFKATYGRSPREYRRGVEKHGQS